MSLTADAVTRILETRFDYYSARVVLKQAAAAASLDAAGPFEGKQLNALADAVLKAGDRTEGVAAALRSAAAPAHPKPAEKAPEAAPAADAAADAKAAAAKGGGDPKKKG